MLEITATLGVPEEELDWSFARSGGPGGQNVNKVASKAVLRWNVRANTSLPEYVKARFCALQRNRITEEGELVLTGQRYRDQERNKQDCLEKLAEMLRQAATLPRPRRITKPTRGSKERRLQAKKQRTERKESRRGGHEE